MKLSRLHGDALRGKSVPENKKETQKEGGKLWWQETGQ